MELEKCKARLELDNKINRDCIKDEGHRGDHVTIGNPTVTWSKNIISASDRLNVLAAERDRYGAALARIRVITMRYEGGQTPVCALAGDIDDIAAEALKEVEG